MATRSEPNDFHALVPWNPIGQFRLLWWLFIHPARFVAYRDQVGNEATRKASAWLISTLIWLPPFIAVVGSGLSLTHRRQATPELYLALIAILPLAWLLTGLSGARKRTLALNLAFFGGFALAVLIDISIGFGVVIDVAGFIPLIMAVSVGVGLAHVGQAKEEVSSAIADGVGFGLLLGVVSIPGADAGRDIVTHSVPYFAAAVVSYAIGFGVLVVLYRSLESGQASLASRVILIMLALAYATLIWIYLLGG